MTVSATPDPCVVKLSRLDHTVPMANLHLMSAAIICDADPNTNPTAVCTPLAHILPDHLAQVAASQENTTIPLARPVYFSHKRGEDRIELYPHCDQTYWFRATFWVPVRMESR
jgi:hypothetical protein